jgi:hypothetical protein
MSRYAQSIPAQFIHVDDDHIGPIVLLPYLSEKRDAKRGQKEKVKILG